MEQIFFVNITSLFAMLFWANAIACAFLLLYLYQTRFSKERAALIFLTAARACHAFHYFVVSGRGILPDLLSVNAGITLLFIGFYFEASAILRILKEDTRRTRSILLTVMVFCSLVFNVTELFLPIPGIRIIMASLGNIAIMLLPVYIMLFYRGSSVFIRSTAVLYGIFLLGLLLRAGNGILAPEVGVLTNNILNSLTFLTLLLQVIISVPAYSLILKDYAEEALMLMATTDKLTGATNRHAFWDAASAIYRNCRLFHTSLAVLFIDIDYFKRVNDQYGHAFGDRVLARLATVIDVCLRDSDLSCRYGGEEFVVLLPRSDCAAANLVAKRLVDETRAATFEEQPDFSFSVSIGIACGVPSPDQRFEDSIARADEAMYQAKRDGRDRIVMRSLA